MAWLGGEGHGEGYGRWYGKGYGKSGAPFTRRCFLSVLLMIIMVVMAGRQTNAHTHTFTASRRPQLVMANSGVKFRGPRSAFMPPTATSFSPPIRSSPGRQESSQFLGGSSSSGLMPPGVASRAPSTRLEAPRPPAPRLTPPNTTSHAGAPTSQARPHPTLIAVDTNMSPGLNVPKFRKHKESDGGWAGMEAPGAGWRQGLGSSGWTHHESGGSVPRHDTYGLEINEDLSHLSNRPSGRWQTTSQGWKLGRGRGRTRLNGGFRQIHRWPIDDQELDDELLRNESEDQYDSSTNAEYHPDDYHTYHDYDQHSHSSKTEREHPQSPIHNPELLTLQDVMEIYNLSSHADLEALLEDRFIPLEELKALLNSGADKSDVLEFLKVVTVPTITNTITATATESLTVMETVTEGSNTQQDDSDQTTRRKKGRRGKGGRRRKNKHRKGRKGHRGNIPDLISSSVPPIEMTATEVALVATLKPHENLRSTTKSPAPDTMSTEPPSLRTSDASIISMILVDVPFDKDSAPSQTTVEIRGPPRRHNVHNTTRLWKGRNPKIMPQPTRPPWQKKETMNEVGSVTREERRDDYVFPLRGLLIISGLMGALAVFTLVVLISYAFIKCSKKPIVNNYQVSEQPKPAGT